MAQTCRRALPRRARGRLRRLPHRHAHQRRAPGAQVVAGVRAPCRGCCAALEQEPSTRPARLAPAPRGPALARRAAVLAQLRRARGLRPRPRRGAHLPAWRESRGPSATARRTSASGTRPGQGPRRGGTRRSTGTCRRDRAVAAAGEHVPLGSTSRARERTGAGGAAPLRLTSGGQTCAVGAGRRRSRRWARARCRAGRAARRRGGPARPRTAAGRGRRGRRARARWRGRTGTCRGSCPLAETAVGSPPDSHWAIRSSGRSPRSRRGRGRRCARRRRSRDAAARTLPSAEARSVAGPATPSTWSPWARWKRRTARRVRGAVDAVGGDAELALERLHAGAARGRLQGRPRRGSRSASRLLRDRRSGEPGERRRWRAPRWRRRRSDQRRATAAASRRARAARSERRKASSVAASPAACGADTGTVVARGDRGGPVLRHVRPFVSDAYGVS